MADRIDQRRVASIPSLTAAAYGGDLDLVVTGRDASFNATATIHENLLIQQTPASSFTASVSGPERVPFPDTGLTIDFATGATAER